MANPISNEDDKMIIDYLIEYQNKFLKDVNGFLFQIEAEQMQQNNMGNLLYPRVKEMSGHNTLSFFESLNKIDKKMDWARMNLTFGLSRLLRAGLDYERIGKKRHSRNAFERVLLAAEDILNQDIDDLLRSMLCETVGLCKLILNEPGAHAAYEIAYEAICRVNNEMLKRTKAIPLDDKAINEQVRSIINKAKARGIDRSNSFEKIKEGIIREQQAIGVEEIFFDEPIFILMKTCEIVFEQKSNPSPTLDEFLGNDIEILTLKRYEYFLEQTKGK